MGKQEEKVLSEELKEAIYDAARAGALTAYGQTAGSYVNYFKATETLLHNFKTLAALVEDEDDYCDVEYHKGKKTFSTSARPTGYVEWKSETEIVEEMQKQRREQYEETKRGFEQLQRTIRAFENQREFIVIRMYYFGEDIHGKQRESKATWEDVAAELERAGILKDIKSVRRWRNKIVNDMAVCIFGIPAALSSATYRKTTAAE